MESGKAKSANDEAHNRHQRLGPSEGWRVVRKARHAQGCEDRVAGLHGDEASVDIECCRINEASAKKTADEDDVAPFRVDFSGQSSLEAFGKTCTGVFGHWRGFA